MTTFPAARPAAFRAPLPLIVGGLGAVSVAAVLAGNGDLALAAAPLLLALVVVAVWNLPLRDTLPILAFLCFTLENPSEASGAGVWRSPLYTVGALFLSHMNVTLPVKALFFSGLDLALVVFAATLVRRRMRSARKIDGHGQVPTARPLRTAALVCLVTIAVVWAYGLLRGGSFGNSLWQLFRVVYLPFVLLLFSSGLRGPGDARRLGVTLMAAALLRALVALHVRQLYPDIEAVPFATIHADSMLFTAAFVLVVVLLLEQPRGRTFALAAVAIPVLAGGMIANNRRLVWVELGMALLVAVIVARRTRLKILLLRGVLLSIPLAVVYVGIGWATPSGVFAPVRTLRSIVDSSADSSTAWRDWENYNIAYTVKRNPLLGTGFGHEYEEVVILPDISVAYPLYRYAPHNSVLGLLAYAGVLGFAGLWMIVPLGVFFSIRAYRFSTTPRDRVATLTALGVLVSYVVHCYGDMGLGTWASVFLVAPAVALVGKIAVANGAWPAPSRATADPVPPST